MEQERKGFERWQMVVDLFSSKGMNLAEFGIALLGLLLAFPGQLGRAASFMASADVPSFVAQAMTEAERKVGGLSLIHISEPTRPY